MYPDFICIGAPKAGTTWLFDNLKRHPQVWLPPVKGVQFFSGRANHKRFKKLWREYGSYLRPHSLDEALWYCRYFLWPLLNDRWYASLFPQSRNRITGEIAPAYTACDKKTVERVHRLMPNANIIFLMRNPVDRAWSHALLGFVTNRKQRLENIDEKELIDSLGGDLSTLKSSYVRTLHNWRAYFDEKQLLIRFFEEIADHPFTLLEDVCKFLGIRYQHNWFERSAVRNIFKGPGSEMPKNIEIFLTERYINDLQQLSEEFNSYATNWLEKAEKVLNHKHRLPLSPNQGCSYGRR
jgi:hypothetical protein